MEEGGTEEWNASTDFIVNSREEAINLVNSYLKGDSGDGTTQLDRNMTDGLTTITGYTSKFTRQRFFVKKTSF